MVVDEVSAISVLLLVVICLGERLVCEEVVVGKLEDELEARAVKVLHPDVDQLFHGVLVALGDEIGQRRLVLHCRKPEFWDTLDGLSRLVGVLLGWCTLLFVIFLVLILLVIFLTSSDLFLSRLGLANDDLGTLLVERSEFGKVLLFELEDLFLKL